MEIYKSVPRFNPITGLPTTPIKAWKETRCDFSGKVCAGGERGDDYPAHYAKYVLDYGDQDPCYGSGGEEFSLNRDYDINVYALLSQPYVVFDDTDEDESEVPAFLASLAEYGSLDNALRSMRVKTVKKLLADGTITPEQLSEF